MNLPAPDPNVDYASWLEHATKGWRIKRKEKRERKQQEDLEDQRREREGLRAKSAVIAQTTTVSLVKWTCSSRTSTNL